MIMKNFLKNRRSVREFEARPLGLDEVSNLKNAISELSEEFGWDDIKLELIEDGSDIYRELDGKAGYAGVMVKAPSYITVQYSNRDKINYLKGAFILGELTTKIRALDLGNCVITLNDEIIETKKSLFGQAGENIDYIVALGFPKGKIPFTPEPTSSRKPLEEIVYTDESFKISAVDKLKDLNMLDLFSVLRYSPSYKNNQPWRFVVKDTEVLAFVENNDDLKHSLTDVGICMYYFQMLVKSMGIRNNWEIVSELVPEGEYIKLGRFKI